MRETLLKSYSMNFLQHLVRFSALVVIALPLTGCLGSPGEAGNVSPGRPVAGSLQPGGLSAGEYDHALSVTASTPEREAVDLAWRVNGTVAGGNVDPADLTAMRQVLVESQTPEVRAAVAAGLGKAMDPDSMPELLDAMEDESPLVRKAAGDAVERMVGLGHAFNADGPIEERQKVIARYRGFWDEARHDTYYEILKTPGKKEELKRQAEELIKQRKRLKWQPTI